jgi:hypothetical protein
VTVLVTFWQCSDASHDTFRCLAHGQRGREVAAREVDDVVHDGNIIQGFLAAVGHPHAVAEGRTLGIIGGLAPVATSEKVPQPVGNSQATSLVTQMRGRPAHATHVEHELVALISTPAMLKSHTWPWLCDATAVTETAKFATPPPPAAQVLVQSKLDVPPTARLPIVLGVARQEASVPAVSVTTTFANGYEPVLVTTTRMM